MRVLVRMRQTGKINDDKVLATDSSTMGFNLQVTKGTFNHLQLKQMNTWVDIITVVKMNVRERERRSLVPVMSAGARKSDATRRKKDRKCVVIVNASGLFANLQGNR